jgi:hypothetical protein
MKRLFLGIATIILFYSCNLANNKNKANTSTETPAYDSKLEMRRDSLSRLRTDSLSLIAWGDAKFGMSLKEVRKMPMFKEASISTDITKLFQTMNLYFRQTGIEGLRSISLSFFEDKLYRVDLESKEKSANYFETYIKDIAFLLKDLVVKKYGNPQEGEGFPSFLKMEPNIEITAFRWRIGNKDIFITVKEVYSGSNYKVECTIYNNKVYEPVMAYYKKIDAEKEAKKVNGF